MRRLRPGIRPPLVLAHRGASAANPENTAAALAAALRDGCDGIETDVQLSADGVPFLYHDRTLARIGAGRRALSSLPAAVLRRLDGGAWFAPRFRGEPLLTLDQALDRFGRRTFLLLELKVRRRDREAGRHRSCAAAAARAIRIRRLQKRCAVLCFDAGTLAAVRAEAPEVRTVLNLRAEGPLPAPVRRLLPSLWALSLDVRGLSAPQVAAAHSLGVPVLTFTCNSRRAVRRALRCGADGILSDRPGWLRAELQEAAILGR